jgi:hypothetical protein
MGTTEDTQRINEAFALLDESALRDVQIDVYYSSIRFSVDDDRSQENHVIVFSDVADFFFTRGHDELRFHDVGRFEPAPDFFTMGEWTAARYYPDGVGLLRVTTASGSLESQREGKYRANPNFAVERSPGTFYIEADRSSARADRRSAVHGGLSAGSDELRQDRSRPRDSGTDQEAGGRNICPDRLYRPTPAGDLST